jgi:hypothetical protein
VHGRVELRGRRVNVDPNEPAAMHGEHDTGFLIGKPAQ